MERRRHRRARTARAVPVLCGTAAGSAALAIAWILMPGPQHSPPASAVSGGPTTPIAAAPSPTPTRSPAAPASAPSSGPAAPATSSPAASATVLSVGSAGPAVVRLQHLLFDQGKTDVLADGYYGPVTELAVREIQSERSLTSDPPGVYGPATRAALDPGGT